MQKSTFFQKLLATITLLMPILNYGQNPQQPPNQQIPVGQIIREIANGVAQNRQELGQLNAELARATITGFEQATRDPAFNDSFGNIAKASVNAFELASRDPKFKKAWGQMAGNALDGLAEESAKRFDNGGAVDNLSNQIAGTINRFHSKAILWPFIKFSLVGVLTTAGTAGAYYGAKALIEEWQRSRKRPQIIIETSYKNMWQRFKNFFTFGKKPEQFDMIFPTNVQSRLDEIAKATKNINQRINEGKTNVKYRNLLLYGKPGTGKTMFARKLAHECGMEFAMMSGSSFTKQGALEEMDHLFKWANHSKGLLLFIDEAESFLLKRETMKTDSYEYKVLTNFLNYTGTRSGKFMVVMATNRLSQIDSAIYRRVDDLVEIPLPGEAERVRVLKLYRDKILLDASQNGDEFVQSVKRHLSETKVQEMAKATERLSNGDLEGIINSIKTSADITASGLLSAAIVDTAVQRYIQKQKEFEAAAKLEGSGKAAAAGV